MSFCFSSASKLLYHLARRVLPARFWIRMNLIGILVISSGAGRRLLRQEEEDPTYQAAETTGETEMTGVLKLTSLHHTSEQPSTTHLNAPPILLELLNARKMPRKRLPFFSLIDHLVPQTPSLILGD